MSKTWLLVGAAMVAGYMLVGKSEKKVNIHKFPFDKFFCGWVKIEKIEKKGGKRVKKPKRKVFFSCFLELLCV